MTPSQEGREYCSVCQHYHTPDNHQECVICGTPTPSQGEGGQTHVWNGMYGKDEAKQLWFTCERCGEYLHLEERDKPCPKKPTTEKQEERCEHLPEDLVTKDGRVFCPHGHGFLEKQEDWREEFRERFTDYEEGGGYASPELLENYIVFISRLLSKERERERKAAGQQLTKLIASCRNRGKEYVDINWAEELAASLTNSHQKDN